MTKHESQSRDRRTIDNIMSVLRVHQQLREYVERLQVSIENAAVTLKGELPSMDLKSELVPAIRRAGVLSRVSNDVHVTG